MIRNLYTWNAYSFKAQNPVPGDICERGSAVLSPILPSIWQLLPQVDKVQREWSVDCREWPILLESGRNISWFSSKMHVKGLVCKPETEACGGDRRRGVEGVWLLEKQTLPNMLLHSGWCIYSLFLKTPLLVSWLKVSLEGRPLCFSLVSYGFTPSGPWNHWVHDTLMQWWC